MWFEKLTFGQLVDRAAEQWGDREALCFAGRRWSFSQFREETDRAAKSLIAAGVEPGDHVCLWLANRPEYLFLFFAIASFKIPRQVFFVNQFPMTDSGKIQKYLLREEAERLSGAMLTA